MPSHHLTLDFIAGMVSVAEMSCVEGPGWLLHEHSSMSEGCILSSSSTMFCPTSHRSGMVPPRSGVLRLMDEARAAGLKVAVCSAATKSSCVYTLQCLLGPERIAALDCFLAGVRVRLLSLRMSP